MTSIRTLSFTAALAAALSCATASNAALLVGVTADNTAVTFTSDDPGTLLLSKPIFGLAPNENVLGIDHRPTTGALYAVGSFGNVYTINLNNIAMPGLATATLQFNLNADSALIADGGLSGSDFGVDFNPVADKSGASSLRIVSNTNQNLAVNVDTGAVTVATDVSYGGGDVNIVGEAYTNSSQGGVNGPLGPNANPAIGTVQYAIDAGTDGLTIQAFNAGTLTPVGSLGINATAKVGFDIFTPFAGNNTAFATIDADGTNTSNLYTINLATGAATNLGVIDGGLLIPHLSAPIAGIDPDQIIPEPASLVLMLGGGLTLLALRKRA